MDNLKVLYIEYYNKAIKGINENNITSAIILLEKSYKINSNNMDINNLLGLCYFKMCNFNKAIFLWKRSIHINDSQDNDAHRYLKFINSNEVKKNISLYIKTLELINTGLYYEAIENLLKLSSLDYGWIDVNIIITLLYLKKKDYSSANKTIKYTLNNDIGNEKAKEYYSYILEKNIANKKIQDKHNDINKLSIYILVSIVIICLISISIIYNKVNNKSLLIVNENLELNNKIEYQQIEIEDKNKDIKEKEVYIKELEEHLKSVQSTLDNLLVKENEGQEQETYINEVAILQQGLKAYEYNQYKDALNILNLILSNSNSNLMLNEATFWIASAYEKLGQYEKAINYYKEYINKFTEYYYYDDSLYMIIILSNKMNNLDEAKKYANKLISECNDSIFNNNVIKNILEK